MTGAASLLAAAAARRKAVEVRGQTVHVQEFTTGVHAAYLDLVRANKKPESLAYLIGHCVVDEAGAPLMTEAEAAQLVANSGAGVINALLESILEVSGARDDDEKKD